MQGFELWLLAIGLAMDCFAVAIASGINLNQMGWKIMSRTSICFGAFQAIMPLIGWSVAHRFSHYIEQYDHWIAFIILVFLGLHMIADSMKKEKDKDPLLPTSLRVTLILALATSIDALAIGVSFAFLGTKTYQEILPSVAVIGLISLLFTAFGLFFGHCCQKGFAQKIRAELWGGIILILIGSKILIEHIFFMP